MSVRPAVPDDAAAVAHVQVTSYRTAYAPHFPPGYWDGVTVEEQTSDWEQWPAQYPGDVWLVAVHPMDVVGYVLARRHDFHGADGEVMAMHVLPEHRGRGHGRELLAAAVRELQSSGCSSVGLSTLEANPIREWYEALGGEPVNVTQDDIDGWIVREVVYRWDNPAQLLSRLRPRPCR